MTTPDYNYAHEQNDPRDRLAGAKEYNCRHADRAYGDYDPTAPGATDLICTAKMATLTRDGLTMTAGIQDGHGTGMGFTIATDLTKETDTLKYALTNGIHRWTATFHEANPTTEKLMDLLDTTAGKNHFLAGEGDENNPAIVHPYNYIDFAGVAGQAALPAALNLAGGRSWLPVRYIEATTGGDLVLLGRGDTDTISIAVDAGWYKFIVVDEIKATSTAKVQVWGH